MLDRAPYLAIVGTHGPPEAVGPALYEMFHKDGPVRGWELVYGDAAAHDAGVRSTGTNLSFAYGSADLHSADYGYRRAAELLQLSAGRELVLDIHDKPNVKGEYAMLGIGANITMLGQVSLFGMRRVVLQPSPAWIFHHRPQTLLLEMCRLDVSPDTNAVDDKAWWIYENLGCASGASEIKIDYEDFEFYTSVCEIGFQQASDSGIDMSRRLESFEPVPQEYVERLGLDASQQYVCEYWNGICSSGTSFGGVYKVETEPWQFLQGEIGLDVPNAA